MADRWRGQRHYDSPSRTQTNTTMVPQGLGASEKKIGSGHPSVCTTSDFHAVLFWFVYDTSAVRGPTLTIGISLERKIT
jgi:hypothetical protein